MESCSIIIPVYQEESVIEKTITELIEVFRKSRFDFEILAVIDIAPNDQSHEIVSKIAQKNSEIVPIIRKSREGLASAIKEGITNANKEITLIVMGDGSENPQDLKEMVKKMNQGFDMVIGNRFVKGIKVYDYPLKKYFANRLCNYVVRLMFGIHSKDITNAVKAYRTKYLKKLELESTGFEIFVEIPIKYHQMGYRNFTEFPLSHSAGDRKYSKFNLSNEGFRYFKTVIRCLLKGSKKK